MNSKLKRMISNITKKSDDRGKNSTKSFEIEELGKLLEKEKKLKVHSNSISEEFNIASLKMEKSNLNRRI